MKKNVLFYIMFFLLISGLLLKQWYDKFQLSSCNKISVSIIVSGSGSFSTRRALLYTYNYDNKEFSGSDGKGIIDYNSFKDFKLYEKKKYFVKFSCQNPDISELIWDIQVPDSLQFIPKNGWDKIPYDLDKVK